MSHAIPKSCTNNEQKDHTKIQAINQPDPTSKLEELDRVSSALRYMLIIHIQKVNISACKIVNIKKKNKQRASANTKCSTNEYWKLALILRPVGGGLQHDSSPTVHIAFLSSQLALVK